MPDISKARAKWHRVGDSWPRRERVSPSVVATNAVKSGVFVRYGGEIYPVLTVSSAESLQ